MRPDPYKRARSRQYKTKHGINECKKATTPDTKIPSNLSEEQINLLSRLSDGKNCFTIDIYL